jgi:alkanesulfonate monooxygenase SsuD/methylene tetrahydromethanopterin reductase-like flavin-dependent oxidoreductase (luciferase family)
MQFGVTDHIDVSGIPPAELLEERLRLVELYEQLGFDRYMLTEHHGTPLSGGRFELGMGRGVSPPEIATYGIDPADTPAMFDEAYEILIKGLGSEAVSHEGRFHSMNDVAMVVPPVQRPRPPLWYGVGSAERAAWAAQNGINVMALRPAKVVRPYMDAFLEAWDETGRPIEERPLRGVDRPLVIAEDGADARRIAADAHAGFHHSLMLLWERTGATPPTHFPPTFDPGSRSAARSPARPVRRASSSPSRSRLPGWTR